jgi:predicted ester cyclase
MSAEQVVRDALKAFETQGVEATSPYLSDQLALEVVDPPIRGGKDEFIGQGILIKEAMPDFKWGIQNVTSQGNQVTVNMRWTGTQTGVFRLSVLTPGAPDIPPTGKRVSVADKFYFTVSGDQITGVQIDSPADGGLYELLRQLGVQLPQ